MIKYYKKLIKSSLLAVVETQSYDIIEKHKSVMQFIYLTYILLVKFQCEYYRQIIVEKDVAVGLWT
jgi:hypothetical protein